MLKSILSISGKPGLFKLISNTSKLIIVESLIEKKRIPVHSREKVVSLGDIAMYTTTGEEPLRNVLLNIQKKENGAKASIAPNAKPDELKAYLSQVLPHFDEDRIYPSDIKKLITWYNILIQTDISFEEQNTPTEETSKQTIEQEKDNNKNKNIKTPSPKASTASKSATRTTRKKV